jgi:hypothetical protein
MACWRGGAGPATAGAPQPRTSSLARRPHPAAVALGRNLGRALQGLGCRSSPDANLTGRRPARSTSPFSACSHPFCYFPCLYLTKGAFEGRPIQSTYNKYKVELWENCKALWTIWVPAQLINFAFVPRHLRIPYGARATRACASRVSVTGALVVGHASSGSGGCAGGTGECMFH